MSSLSTGGANVGAILGAIKSSVKPVHIDLHRTATAVAPFVTISRQAGAGGRSVGEALAKLLAQRDHTPWQCYDRELVEKVAADHQNERSLVEVVDEQSHSWLKDMFVGLAGPATPGDADEFKIVRRMAATIRAIAQVGHAIIVGRGGAFITARMPGGVRVRLIAPLERRIKHYAQLHGLTEHDAAEQVTRIDDNRRALFARYWPGRVSDPLSFTLTVNTDGLSDDQVARTILPLVPS